VFDKMPLRHAAREALARNLNGVTRGVGAKNRDASSGSA
jgi:hypothetical protein